MNDPDKENWDFKCEDPAFTWVDLMRNRGYDEDWIQGAVARRQAKFDLSFS